MSVELAAIHAVPKPWGRSDLKPWSDIAGVPDPIGELWFAHPNDTSPESPLLFKLIFADAPLSIQVHPDDAFARQRGLPNGKTEAWYILSATAEAEIAVGLKKHVDANELRRSIADGSINALVAWRRVSAGEVIVIPAGTIHAIGAGVVLAEIQQNSDSTFRLYDFGRGRELHVDDAIAVADAGPLTADTTHHRIDRVRDILVANPYFILEHVELAPHSSWSISATFDMLVFVLAGNAAIGLVNVEQGCAAFLNSGDQASVETGIDGMRALVTYPGPDAVTQLLTRLPDLADEAFLPVLPQAGRA